MSSAGISRDACGIRWTGPVKDDSAWEQHVFDAGIRGVYEQLELAAILNGQAGNQRKAQLGCAIVVWLPTTIDIGAELWLVWKKNWPGPPSVIVPAP